MSKTAGSFIALTFLMLLLAVSAKAEIFTAYLSGTQEVPANASAATGYARVNVNETTNTLTFTVVFNNLGSTQSASHIHAPAAIGANAGVIIDFGNVGGTSGTISGSRSITAGQLANLRAGLGYINVHSTGIPSGEIRGQLAKARPVDYDGDGRMDMSNLRFPNAPAPAVAQITYHNAHSTEGYVQTLWGDANTDFPAPGDYDGDGKGDIAIFRSGANAEFWVLYSSNGWARRLPFGTTGDQAHARDYDGDGKTDMAVFRRGVAPGAAAGWWIYQSSTETVRQEFFGTTGATDGSFGDTPVSGDYDGDGKFDLAVYRFGGIIPNNTFIYKQSSDTVVKYVTHGNFTSDYIVPGDYDGDGKFDFMAARTGATSTTPVDWWLLRSSDGGVSVRRFGISSDLPVQGDYDGDGRADIAMYRRGATASSPATYWVFNSFTGVGTGTNWGLAGDFPAGTFDAR